jgi:hypothetical protein
MASGAPLVAIASFAAIAFFEDAFFALMQPL